MATVKCSYPCANLRHGLNPIFCCNSRLPHSISRTKPSFPQQDRVAIVPSGQASTSCFLPTCARTLVSYVELDFGDGVQGKGAVPLPLLSSLEAVLAASTTPDALFSSDSRAGGPLGSQLRRSARPLGSLPSCGRASNVPRMVDLPVASRTRR